MARSKNKSCFGGCFIPWEGADASEIDYIYDLLSVDSQ